ncbi:hypothetical protein Mgra_00003386 [Meloidogyne graminicola]|uniref:Uncharacterized protein n=1 Tax=Meloidogyne graminicola TaxID=189291 RepID=A0A8S9ZVC4_9BILA|nr:hypothetical protein Mgra_00003386 [Meloidogyne graminicola]
MQKQLFFAQCLKLLVLFSVAIAQIIYLHPFLELFSHLEEYSAKFEFLQQIQLKQPILIVDSVHDLNEVGIFDAFSFGCLPFLFSTRGCIIQKIKLQLGQALVQAHKISSAEKLMNEAQCSVQPREKLPLCSDLILRSIFPVDLLKFLLILCAMTLAYLLVAYLIYWCIKHWVPHNDNLVKSSSLLCHCYYFNNSLSPLLLENNKYNHHKNPFLINESLPLPNKQIPLF